MAGNNYGRTSLERLGTVHPVLQDLMKKVGEKFPNTILEGHRSEEQQRKNIEKGVSKTMNSLHLSDPAMAVDAAPDPLEWPQVGKLLARIERVAGTLTDEQEAEIMALVGEYVKDVSRWYYFGGYVLGVASEEGVSVRWGGDWDGDRDIGDQTFDDLPHFEFRL